MKEVWKDVVGYEGLYEVSNLGRVRSWIGTFHIPRKTPLILKPNTQYQGYKTVTLNNNGKRKTFLVHRLVAEAFIPNPNNLPQVNHKDEDKTNNACWNLEYCDCKYNQNWGTRNKRVSKANSYAIQQIDIQSGNVIAVYQNAKEASKHVNVCKSLISQVARNDGIHKSAGGFLWKYVC